MFKVVIGHMYLAEMGKQYVVAICLNHTSVAHADIADGFSIETLSAGFCSINNDSGFIDIYGNSVSLNKSCSDVDNAKLNAFLREYPIVQMVFKPFHDSHKVWLCISTNEITAEGCYDITLNASNIQDTATVLDFDKFRTNAIKDFKILLG